MPKKGTSFPQHPTDSYAPAIALTLHRQLGETHQAVKIVMRWTGAGERTVKNWFSGKTGPSGQHLLALIRHSDEVLNTLLLISGRQQMAAANRIVEIRNALVEAVERIDRLLVPRESR